MKLHLKGSSFWGFSCFLLAILLCLSIYGVRLVSNHKNSPENISSAFQKKIDVAESELISRIDLLSRDFSASTTKAIRAKSEYSDNGRDESSISLFVYKGDSLIFWNDNKVVLPANMEKSPVRNNFALHLKNGWYVFHARKKDPYNFLGCYLIKSEYPFQNEFIKNQFSSGFNLPGTVAVEGRKGFYPVYAVDKTFLFSLNFDKFKTESDPFTILIFFLFIGASLFFIYFLFYLFLQVTWFNNKDNLKVVAFCLTLVLLRVLLIYLKFPAEMFQSELFSPAWYSSSSFMPSMGDFILNAMLLLIISLVVYKKASIHLFPRVMHWSKHLGLNTLLLILLLGFFQLVGYLVADLVQNSALSLNLQNISGLTFESGYGLFIVAALLFSLWLIAAKVFDFVFSIPGQSRWFALSAILAGCVYTLICTLAVSHTNLSVTLFFEIYVAACWYLTRKEQRALSVQNLLFFLCFFSVFATVLLNRSNRIKEMEKLNLMAGKLVMQRNPVTEVLYEQAARKLHADSVVNQWILPVAFGKKFSQDSMVSYLKSKYFSDYWKKYQIQITCCEPMKELRIQPQGYLVNCNSYFRGIISNYGKATILPNLFFLDYGSGKEYYIGIISQHDFETRSEAEPAIFIEFNLRNASQDPGYPVLLMEKTRIDLPGVSDYSYGLYQSGKLIRAVGTNSYKMELEQYKGFSISKPSFSEDGMIYFQYQVSVTDTLLISKKEENFLSLATPFSYLFLLFSTLAILIAGVIHFPKNLKPFPATLRNRLHFSLIGILVLTLVAIGIVQVINIIQINSKKNIDNLHDRANSVLVEVQHKYGQLSTMQEVGRDDLEDFLIKLSNVFFTDINIYGVNGRLISSSRPQIFEEGLLSERMNAKAYYKIALEKFSIFIHHESIGSMQFNSAYLPFFNEQDQLLGFVNLPYFAKQDESKKEISTFLVTFLNVYILLILFGVFVTVLISNYITAPLAMLAGKISQFRLGMINEKINWKTNDEIGQLVSQYNRMIDELGKSAEMLARSERESAWREMARQVAHEIKNPLTPMKLSVQYLEKAWKDKAPDWDQRLARFTKTLVEQIDALSVIATDFSDFAKMQTVVYVKINLEEVIRFVLSLYEDTTRIQYEFKTEVAEPSILGDRSQVIRMFTNLLNNAVQAIDVHQEGKILIHLTRELHQIIVIVADNGCGIPPEQKERIFQPEFTTKTGGMGLGLAIVKGIAEGMNGTISFTSEEQKGTSFILNFPEYGKQISVQTK